MLSENDKEYVIERIAACIATSGHPRQALAGPFVNTQFALQLTQGGIYELARDAVRICINDGWNHDPTWMQFLFDIFQLRIIDAKIAEIWERSKYKPPAAQSPLSLTVLNNSTPFINRTSLRHKLLILASYGANLQPILIINGKLKCGKSYSTNYIDHFSNLNPSIVNYRIEFDPSLGLGMSAQQVSKDLVSMMGRPITNSPQADTNLKLYTRQLAIWVLSEATQTPYQHWFIFDNFHGDNLLPDTRNFIIELSDLITTGIFAQRCRLILIQFDRALLKVDPGKITEEVIAQCTQADIECSINEILQRASSVINFNRVTVSISSGLSNNMLKLNFRLRSLLYAINELNIILSGVPQVDFEAILFQVLEGLPEEEERIIELQKRLNDLSESIA